MAFEAGKKKINEVLKGSVFSIPRNQRRYVWKKENWEDLYSDIAFSIQTQKSHFIGSIVLEKNTEKNGLSYFTIIDGQQRMITISMALVAIMKLFLEKDMQDAFRGTIAYLQSTDNINKTMININSDYHISLYYIINGIISLTDGTTSINSFLNSNTASKQKDKSIIDSVKYFYSTIKKDIDGSSDPNERLIQVRDALVDMTVIRIVSDSNEDSYTIFEILNARGQDLDPSELIKNYIMRYIHPEETRDTAKQQWEQMENLLGSNINIQHFFKHYVIHKYSVSNDREIDPYNTIKKNFKDNNDNPNNFNDLLRDIILKSNYYLKIINPTVGNDGNCNEYEAIVFRFFKKRNVEQFRPILLSVIHQREQEKISEEKYKLLLRYLYVFYVCYSIIGEESSNKLPNVVRKYAPVLETNCSDDILQEFCNNLKSKLPGYEWFLNAFKNIGWSNHYDIYKGEKNKHRVQIIIELIEKYISQNDYVSEFTIEHMLPDNESISHSQIGNLIPLEERYNESLNSNPLNQKYDTYAESSFSTARSVSKRYNGKTFDPSQRTEFLAKLIYNNILELNQLDFSKDE